MIGPSKSVAVAPDRDLAYKVLTERAALRSAVLERTAPSDEQTVVLDLLADMLIERIAEALADATWTPLLSWADVACNERAQAPAIRRLFASTVPTIREILDVPGFEQLESAFLKIVNKPRLAEPGIRNETVDELDVLLADLLSRIETADEKTAEHCRAVSAWCARIANKMQFTRSEGTFVARGGLIHDIGKSKCPTELLRAPRPLTDAETSVIRQHVITGAEIIAANAKLTDFGGMVRLHHERFDGAGYPDGMDRTRIPIGVRIVSVADSFNAMIGRRPYRTPFSPARAAAELQCNAGSQFDPDVVRALIDVIAS
ncbi:MAG: HD-GYP domain-containing protein [Vulcanimicrobiaceae bacterium]